MKLLGIDYGSKRVGVAITDDSGNFALPYDVFANDSQLTNKLINLCIEKKIGKIIIGRSIDYKRKENLIMSDIIFFSRQLQEKTDLKIEFEDESLTTKEATHIQGDTKKIDASAAALILKSYIDRCSNSLDN